MQAINHQSSLSAMSCLSDVEQIIDRHLRRDWLIRIPAHPRYLDAPHAMAAMG